MDFLLENQPALDDDDLLHDGDHRGVALLPGRRCGIDHPADRHPLDLDALMGEFLVDQVIVAGRSDL